MRLERYEQTEAQDLIRLFQAVSPHEMPRRRISVPGCSPRWSSGVLATGFLVG